MNVTFYKGFAKRPNSFKVPVNWPEADTLSVDGEIKGDFSPLAPVIRFSASSFPADVMPTPVYCSIASFSRYYFASWAFVSGFWEASLTCDTLASFRAQILDTSQYVERSASRVNPNIIDGEYAPTVAIIRAHAELTQEEVWGAGYAAGTYVVGVVSPSDLSLMSNVGAVRYYAMSQLGFSALMYSLLSSPNWMQIDASEISQELQKALINPAQYIVSAFWLPIPSATFIGTPGDFQDGSVVTSIKLGWWNFNIGVNARILYNPTGIYDSWSRWVTFSYIKHPQTSIFGDWINVSPYAKYTLDFPPFGCVDLDTTDLKDSDGKLSIHVFVQAYTGDATAYIFDGDAETYPTQSPLIGTLHANLGVQLPTGQIRMNLSDWKNAVTLGAVVGGEELVNILTEGD